MEDVFTNEKIRHSKLAQDIAEDIRQKHSSGKLKDAHMKKFLKSYYDGNPYNDCPARCKGDCLLDCYIEIHQSLIDDEGKLQEFKTPYQRDTLGHCCGSLLRDLPNKNYYCEVCASEYRI